MLLCPSNRSINKERRLVVTTAWDRVTFEEFVAHQDRLLSDPDFNPEFNQLLDGTTVTAVDVSTDQIKTLTSRTVFSTTSKRAFVVSNVAFYGIGRMAETYFSLAKSPSQVTVFYDLPSALKWVGVSEGDIKPSTQADE